MKRELDHLARFLHMAVDYEKEIGFTGQFYIEPKPKEPTKHQYDSDAAACLNFLRDVRPARRTSSSTSRPTTPRSPATRCSTSWKSPAAAGALGSIDANTGDLLLGWDTDQFPTDIYLTTQCMLAHPQVWAASRPAASTSTPRSAARASSRSTCSTPTSAAWTPSPAASRSPHAIRRRRPARRVRQGALRELGQRPRQADRGGQGHLRRLEARALELGDLDIQESGRQELLENLINECI